MISLTDILIVLAAIVGIAYVYFSWDYDYWKKRDIPFVKPVPFFGNFFSSVTGRAAFYQVLDPAYKQLKSNGYGGVFQSRQPVLLVCDPELVKQVLTKEFSSFHDRGQPVDEENDPLSANLFGMSGNRWKLLRAQLSPTFTSGKMKLMFPLMVDIGKELNDVLRDSAKKGECVEFNNVLVRYATDIIGSCAFGISCNSLKNPESEFNTMTREIFKRNTIFIIRIFLISIHPAFSKLMPFKALFPKLTNFFINLMKDTVEYREKHNVDRNDFVKLMMQLRKKNDALNEQDKENAIDFTPGVMTAQAFLFFIAGLDNIANTVAFSLHELALNPDLQVKAAESVKTVLEKYDGNFTYEALQEMDFVDRIISESLRKWSPVGVLLRNVTNPSFTLPDSNVAIGAKPAVMIPVWQIMHDPDIYPDPDRFDPDRFTEEAKESRHPYAYLPFGEGPRICIAQRFAMLEMKMALATLLKDFKFSVCSKTDVKSTIETKKFSPFLKNGFWLKIEERA